MATSTSTLPLPPGPKGRPVVGCILEFRKDRLGFFTRCVRDHGDIVWVPMGVENLVLVADPVAIRHIMQERNRDYTKATRGYDALRKLLGDGLLTAEGDTWFRQRRLMQPVFIKRSVRTFADIMVEESEACVARWTGQTSTARRAYGVAGDLVDVEASMMELTLRIVVRALFGTSLDPRVASIAQVSDAVDKAQALFTRQLSGLALPDWVPTPRNRQLREAVETLHSVVDDIIARRRRQLTDDPDATEDGDLLTLLMLATDADTGERMSDRQLRDEVLTLFLAGHETTATALTWTLYLLSRHPDIARRVREELAEVLGTPPRPPGWDDLGDLRFVTHVAQEAMRLYPPAWIMGRRATVDDEIGGYRIPAGCQTIILPWVVHRNPRLWDNPEGFDPDRWSTARVQELPRFAYMPFGGGPRLCIGEGFARAELVLALATILSHVRLDLAAGHDVGIRPQVTLQTANGLPMRVTPLR